MSTIVREMLKDYYGLDDPSRFDLDRVIDILVRTNGLADDELVILQLTVNGTSTKEIAKTMVQSITTINRKITGIASKISEMLGDEYRDDRILEEVRIRLGRPLTSEEAKFCWKVIRAGHPLEKGINISNFNGEEDVRQSDEDKTEG